MSTPTGKLAFAYSTIQKMESRIAELEAANAELLEALVQIAANANNMQFDAYVHARAAIKKHGGAT